MDSSVTGSSRAAQGDWARSLASDGYAGPIPVLPHEEVLATASAFASSLPQAGTSLANWHLRFDWAEALALDPRITRLADAAMGEPTEVWASEIWYKPPGHGRVVPWHQDEVFWPVPGLHCATVWLAIAAAGPENGGLSLVAGSHLQALPHRRCGTSVSYLDHEVAGEISHAHTPFVPAGSALVFDARTVHGSRGNTSVNPRLAISFRFTPRRDRLSGPAGDLVARRAPGASGSHNFLVGWQTVAR